MSKIIREIISKYVVNFDDIDWIINLYLIKSNKNENIAFEDIYMLIKDKLKEIQSNNFSEEFTYLKTGFAFIHYGNRGINLSIWHVGKWGNTYEIFKKIWYCYNRDLKEMETLDDCEPIISQFEFDLFNKEIVVIGNILSTISGDEQLRQEYINYYSNIST